LRRKGSSLALVLILLGTLAFAFTMQVGNSLEINGADGVQTDVKTGLEALDPNTLAGMIQSIETRVDWGKATYAGVLLHEKSKTDLEIMIDNYATSGDWVNVLKWTAICKKLGIERENAIKSALNGLPMIGPLPWTINYGGTDYFCVEHKFALLGYYYAEKYGYRLDKWNKTNAYDFFKRAIDNNGRPVLFVGASGSTWTIGYGPRYYDEAACTIQCFLIFYEFGTTDALNDALKWWNWTNDNLWYQGTHYKYALSSADYECEAGFFAKIAANLKYYEPSLMNWDRVLSDLQNRFLISKWNSPQWFSGSEGKTTYVTVHHYPSNSQRRLQNTIGAWSALNAFCEEFTNSSQNSMQDMIKGYGGLDPAWKLLLSSIAGLYDNSTFKFRWESTSSFTDDATGHALTLLFLLGITPKTAILAFPLEEYTYEYIYDIDPELYNINLDNNVIRVSIVKEGQLEFNYGNSPVRYTFPSSGIYEIGFSADWNYIVYVSRLQDLPENRRFHGYLPQNLSLTIDMPFDGTTNPPAGNYSYAANSTVEVAAIPRPNCVFNHWKLDDVDIGNSNPLNVTMDSNHELKASFTRLPGFVSDIAITNAASEKTVIGQGYATTLNVTVVNRGDFVEDVDVTFFADLNATILGDEIVIGNLTIHSLLNGTSVVASLTWNTSGAAKGVYTVSAYAWPTLGETDTSDNTFSDGQVYIGIPGDISADHVVDSTDLGMLGLAYGSYRGASNYASEADLNDDGVVDSVDLGLMGAYWGATE